MKCPYCQSFIAISHYCEKCYLLHNVQVLYDKTFYYLKATIHSYEYRFLIGMYSSYLYINEKFVDHFSIDISKNINPSNFISKMQMLLLFK